MTPTVDLAASLQAPAKAAPKTSVARGDVAGARKTAEDFAAFFFSQSFETIFGSMSSDSLFGGGSAEGVYKSLLTQEYGKIAARTGGMGIADTVQREILRLQEMA
jgi:peptidoglycan hydrolase FlgJ